MKVNHFFLFLLLSFHVTQSKSQKLIEILNKPITVNGHITMDGYTRNFTDVKLPRGTVAYAYRISLYKIDGVKLPDKLIDVLNKEQIDNLKPGYDISKYNVKNAINGGEVDYFIFTRASEADHFFNKEVEIWKGCKSFLKSESTCALSDECLGSQFFFGFRNNSSTKGVDANLEVVAIVDEDQALINQSMNAYEIKNTLTTDMTFQLSADGNNWTDYTVPTRKFRDLQLQ